MRFVSQYPGFTVGIQSERRRLDMDGGSVVTRPGVWCEFKAGAMNQHDLEFALRTFQFKGLFQNEDEVGLAHPAYRIAVFDTDEEYERRLGSDEEWTPEFKAMVEQRLLGATSYGRSFVQVPEQVMEPPWPNYHSFDRGPEALVHFVIDLGVPYEDVLAYETSKWGERREEVIEALKLAIELRDEGKVIIDA